jgi:hypothetical protein
MLQHTPHPAPWVKMRLVSKVQVGHSVVDLDDSESMCEAVGSDPLMSGIGIPADSMLPDSRIICGSSHVVALSYSQEHCESLGESGLASCPPEHSPAAQQQWSSLLEQVRSNVKKTVHSVIHAGAQLPKELRYLLFARATLNRNKSEKLNHESSFGETISCPEWCGNFAQNILSSLDGSGQVRAARLMPALIMFCHVSSGVPKLPSPRVHGVG